MASQGAIYNIMKNLKIIQVKNHGIFLSVSGSKKMPYWEHQERELPYFCTTIQKLDKGIVRSFVFGRFSLSYGVLI